MMLRPLALVAIGGCLLLLAWAALRLRSAYPLGWGGSPPQVGDRAAAAMADAAWQGMRAMADIAALLAYSPRSPGTPGQAATLAYIEREIARTGRFEFHRQSFSWRREDGAAVPLVNLVARLDPEKPVRILLGTHHDSLSRAVRDQVDPHAPMPGAHNSGSGVAVLLETARALAATKAPAHIGVDLVFFDGEEGPYGLGAGEERWQPLGSTEFVRRIGDFYHTPPAAVVIIDLVGRDGLLLRPELASLETGRREAARMWRIGKSVAPEAFAWRALRRRVGDDHRPFWQAGIPAILLIDIRRPEWFDTTRDTLDKCRPESLAAVGRALMRYVHSAR